jgi:phosphosulfolactate synthase
MSTHAFPMFSVPPSRSRTKPRKTGLTMLVDWGQPLGAQADMLDMSGAYLDLAKIAVVSIRVYTEDQLRRKIELYARHGVRCFIGGGAAERLYALEGPKALEAYFREARRVGIEVVEISDNYVTLDKKERQRQIRMARDCGLAVFGEIGSKHQKNDTQLLIEQANDSFEAGAELVIVEAAEMVEDGKPLRQMIDTLRKEIDAARTMFELPGPWISGINAAEVQDLKKVLIEEFGPDINLGNVLVDDLFETEMSRQGFGVVQPTKLAW